MCPFVNVYYNKKVVFTGKDQLRVLKILFSWNESCCFQDASHFEVDDKTVSSKSVNEVADQTILSKPMNDEVDQIRPPTSRVTCWTGDETPDSDQNATSTKPAIKKQVKVKRFAINLSYCKSRILLLLRNCFKTSRLFANLCLCSLGWT